MSRDNTRRSEVTANSFASFGNSTVSDFDPEGEAMASTRQMENQYRVPNFSASAKKQREYPPEEPDYAIDTSAIERAFPEFSQVNTSEEDDDISIEVGRGANKPVRRLDDSRNSLMSVENSVRSSSPAVRLDHITSQTPLKSGVRGASRRAVSENLRRDAQLRRAGLAQKEALDSQNAKGARKDQRRTLSEMHARVRDSYDGSFIEDERPPAVSINARPTRFSRNDLSDQIADAVQRASEEAYAKEVRRAKMAAGARNPAANGTHTTNTFADTMTHQSFLLPDLPNLSELVSGVYEDGTPVYTRQKTRATRFVSPNGGDVSLTTREHVPLGAVPIPEDEKALFVSLRLLQDKVAELELAKSEAEKRIEEMRQENASLKVDKSRQKAKHGRARSYEMEEDEDYRRDGGRYTSDKSKWEAANLSLQNELDIMDRKIQLHEATHKRLTRDREMAISQLGVAYLETQELKEENETLKQENAELKTQLAKFAAFARKSRDEDTQESEQTAASDEEDSQIYTRRSADVSRSTKDLTSKSARSRSKSKREDTKSRILNQVDKEISRLEKERADEELFSITKPQSTRASASKIDKPESRSKTESASTKKQPNTGKQRRKRVILEEYDVSEPVELATEEVADNTKKSSKSDQDVTLLSFMDEREIAQLRKTLEEERLARKQRQSTATKDHTANETVNTTRQGALKAPMPRKSSLKETNIVPPRPASAADDLTTATKASLMEGDSNLSVPVERQRRHSDHSLSTPSQRRRRRLAEEMTSALILPDITLRFADLAVENPAKLPAATQKVLDSIAQHDGKNCTVCKRCIPGDSTCNHTHETVKIPKPVPVSERMPDPSVLNEDPTLRPAQEPAVALATVLKALEDELSHLKMQLAAYQAAYNKHDASLSKRKRKSLHEKIEKLLKDIDMKSDQIYALYDVLEGQKQAGHEMTEHEVEVTLQSIGVEIPTSRAADVTATTDKSSRKNADTDYDDDDEELPWEGIESTAEVTGQTSGNRH